MKHKQKKTRPDFSKYFPTSMVNEDRAIKACNDLWTTHVEPLQAENERLKKGKEADTIYMQNLQQTFSRLQSENQKLRDGLKRIIQSCNGTAGKDGLFMDLIVKDLKNQAEELLKDKTNP